MSLHSMMESVCTIFRPTSVVRDANQGTVQVFTVLQPALACSQQQMSASKQLLYRQNDAFVGATLYFEDDPGTTADDLVQATSDLSGATTNYLVMGRAQQIPALYGEVWTVDCQYIQSPVMPPQVVLPTVASVTGTTAVVGGTVQTDGNAELLNVGVVWSQTAVNNYPVVGGTGVSVVASAAVVGTFTVALSGLAPGTTYSFAPYARNNIDGSGGAGGTTYGTVTEFSTAS